MDDLNKAREQFVKMLSEVGIQDQRSQMLQLCIDMMKLHKETYEAERYHAVYRAINGFHMVPKLPDV